MTELHIYSRLQQYLLEESLVWKSVHKHFSTSNFTTAGINCVLINSFTELYQAMHSMTCLYKSFIIGIYAFRIILFIKIEFMLFNHINLNHKQQKKG